MPELIDIESRGPAAVITLRREAKLNALSSELEGQLSSALRDERVRGSACVIVAGGGLLAQTDDAREAANAFAEKREPRFMGR